MKINMTSKSHNKVSDQYHSDARLVSTFGGQRKFLPGHRCLIMSFVKDINNS